MRVRAAGIGVTNWSLNIVEHAAAVSPSATYKKAAAGGAARGEKKQGQMIYLFKKERGGVQTDGYVWTSHLSQWYKKEVIVGER